MIPNIWFTLLAVTKCLANVFMELSIPAPSCQSWPVMATCELRVAFPRVHHQPLRFGNSLQSILIFNTQNSFVSCTNLLTSLFTPFQLRDGFAEQTAHISRGHHCSSTSTTRPGHALPLSVFCFYSFPFYSSRDLPIHALTFLKSLWWEILSAALRK